MVRRAAALLTALALATVIVPAAISTVPSVDATGGSGCSLYDPPWNTNGWPRCTRSGLVKETTAPGLNRLAGDVIPADAVYCNTAMYATCPASTALPGFSGQQMKFLPLDPRSSIERQMERDLADAINFERVARGLAPLVLSDHAAAVTHREMEMMAADPQLSWNGTSSDCPDSICHNPAPYFNLAALINSDNPGPFMFLTGGYGSPVTSTYIAGNSVVGYMTSPPHRAALLTLQGDYVAPSVKCNATTGLTYENVYTFTASAAKSVSLPANYEAVGGTDVTPRVSPYFGHHCPRPQGPATAVGGPGTLTVTRGSGWTFTGRCATTPDPATEIAVGSAITFQFRAYASDGRLVAVRNEPGGSAPYGASTTFTGLAAGTYRVEVDAVSACDPVGSNLPTTIANVTVSSPSPSTTITSPPSSSSPATSTTIPSNAPPAVSAFAPMAPRRQYDSRIAGGKLVAGETRVVQLPDAPPSALGAVLNVTVDQPASAGFVTVYPCATGRPSTSSLNFAAGTVVAGQVNIGISAGAVCVFTMAATHVIVDAAGWFSPSPGAGFVPAQRRVVDTRNTPAAGRVVQLDLSDAPASASAVSLNLTATDHARSSGFLTVYPCNSPRPVVSNLNWSPAQPSIANHATVTLAAGPVCVFTSASTEVVADLTGWWAAPASTGFVGLAPPVRLVDTRSRVGGVRLEPGVTQRLTPRTGSGRSILTATVDAAAAAGWVAIFPCAAGYAGTSTVNVAGTDPAANTVIVDLDGGLCARSNVALDLIIDLTASI